MVLRYSVSVMLSSVLLLWSGNLSARSVAEQVSHETGLPPALIQAVIDIESDRNPAAVSPKGAQGLMQLMPATAKRFGVRDAFEPLQNVRAGSQYLLWLYQRYQRWDLALAAYNAGEGTVDRYGRIPPYRETRRYVRKVLKRYSELQGSSTQEVFVKPVDYGQVQKVSSIDQEPIYADNQAHASAIFFE